MEHNHAKNFSRSDAGKNLLVMLDAVEDFQLKFKQIPAVLTKPTEMSASLAYLRKKLTMEESNELVLATDRGEMDEYLDACVDLLYVVLGNVVLTGLKDAFIEAFWRVHLANMDKVLVEKRELSKRDSAWDIVKPEGWTKPDLSDLVQR